MLLNSNWSNLNSTDVNIAFRELQQNIDHCLDVVAPLKMVKIPNHKIWREPWLTKGLSRSIDKCVRLYSASIKNNSTQECVEKYKIYRNCLTQIKHKAKATYYVQYQKTLATY